MPDDDDEQNVELDSDEEAIMRAGEEMGVFGEGGEDELDEPEEEKEGDEPVSDQVYQEASHEDRAIDEEAEGADAGDGNEKEVPKDGQEMASGAVEEEKE